uniref:Protein kinase domain-containing protein n=1 Tax=Kalanchoe fedtschenkoi TaxID=63787 RepID=A0A7N0TW67_KALFE
MSMSHFLLVSFNSTSAPKAATSNHYSFDARPPSNSVHKHYHFGRNRNVYSARGPTVNKHSLSPLSSPIQSPSPSIKPTPYNLPILPPAASPMSSSSPSSTVLSLPSPPPNTDCSSISCGDPLTYAASGSPCGCVLPIKVQLQLNVALYTFFPLVSVLAREIAANTTLKRSQVRIMGADASDQQRDKTIVLVYLIPLGKEFDKAMAMSTYLKFWRKQILVDSKQFGAFDVLYVHYPGLPPSPPSPLSSNAAVVKNPNNGSSAPLKPLGVDVPKTKQKDSMHGSTIFIIALSSFTIFSICMAFTAVLLYKQGCCSRQRYELTPEAPVSLKPSAMTAYSRTSSANLSFSSSTRTYAGTAKTFTYNDIEKATDRFNPSSILGEGGFGLVYSGVLDDGTRVAVKVLKRDDQQGSQEFLAEIEMLSRLHHRNLVKLIGICVEEQARCLVYELISNGSVDSHLHGVDKERSPLDWAARMKIALGAARALAYLHEDSNPRVIHRDFKSSNILLEDDFNPKVSDFGLAKAAIDEVVGHTSTRVMGTFGYLAPEYAMTGHLLVKSDVYSYGVVLLELLTGRKPVDLSQPPGQENLVAWVRPLLTIEQRLHEILDPTVKSNALMDSVAKVAAIASMCVQPEVSNRPFMGEVVQALKLVCNEFNELQEFESKLCTHHELPAAAESKSVPLSGELSRLWLSNCGVSGYDSEDGAKVALSATNLATPSSSGMDNAPGRRYSSSGPLKIKKRHNFWQRLF